MQHRVWARSHCPTECLPRTHTNVHSQERDLDAANRRNESVLADKARADTALREARIRVNELTTELQALKDDASSAARVSVCVYVCVKYVRVSEIRTCVYV